MLPFLFFAISGVPKYIMNRKTRVSQLYNIIVSEGICTSYLIARAYPGEGEIFMKIRFELSNIESETIVNTINSMAEENFSLDKFNEAKKESYKWGSASKENGIIELELKTEFILDCIDAVKPFADMAKGLIPAVKSLLEQAQNRMSKWTKDIREISQEVAKDLWEKNGHDIVVVAGYSTHDWVEYKLGYRKFMEVGVHTPIVKKSELEKILESDKDAKFYIFGKDGSFHEATVLKAAAKLW